MNEDLNSQERPQSSRKSSELLDLMWEFSENKISPAGAARLSEMLSESEANRDAYQQFMQMVADLEWGQFGGMSLGIELKELVQLPCLPDSAKEPEKVLLSSLDQMSNAGVLAGAVISPANADLTASPRGDLRSQRLSVFFRPPLVYATISAAMLLSALASTAWMHQGVFRKEVSGTGSNLMAAQQKIVTAAYLTSATGCNWSGSGPSLQTLGDGVCVGEEIRLYDGAAEFRLESGVELSIQGPASLVITSPSSIVMQHGKFSVRVPDGVNDFRASACASRITARNARFGAKVVGNRIALHVFSGDVLAASYSAEDSFFERTDGESDEFKDYFAPQVESDLVRGSRFSQAIVSAGRALDMVSDGGEMKVSKWLAADENLFSVRLPEIGALPVSPDYVAAVMKSSPSYYWRFEKRTNSHFIKDEIANKAGLRIYGHVKFVGDSQNRVIEFGQPGLEGFVATQRSLQFPSGSDYSCEVWVKPFKVNRAGIISVIKEPRTALQAFFLEFQGSAGKGKGFEKNMAERVRFMHRDPLTADPKSGTSCYSAEKYQPNAWHHFVATKEGKQLQLYVNGKLSATSEDDSSLESTLHLTVGRSSGKLLGQERPFVGQLDELSIYDRALTEEEIQEHYKAIIWEVPKEQKLADKEEV